MQNNAFGTAIAFLTELPIMVLLSYIFHRCRFVKIQAVELTNLRLQNQFMRMNWNDTQKFRV